jgi:acetyl-CoA carboxylase carboxyl transferase subunit alpha
VISPEGCASILWRDGKLAPAAAEALKITAPDLLRLGIIDRVVGEPEGGAHNDPAATLQSVKSAVLGEIQRLQSIPSAERLALRYEKFAAMGR